MNNPVRREPSNVELLERRLGADWAAIRKARGDTASLRRDLDSLFRDRNSPDTSVVVFGSVAREEVTSSSDLDWILLVDGSSVPEHKLQEREIERTLAAKDYIEPGQSGVFGKMVGSHDLVHNLGGEDDLNSNTTRRVLLLLESLPISNREAYDRVRRQILRRYLEDDRGLLYAGGEVRVPRFLINDLTRYWRTITVDFVYKQRADNDRKWALRNAKLRMSRKLVFAAGLLQCFFCHLDADASPARDALRGMDLAPLTTYMEDQLSCPPLEIVAKACLTLRISDATSRLLFNSYDRFLSILDDQEKRAELARAHTHEDLRGSKAWDQVRAVSRPFHAALIALFLKEDEDLKNLTFEYGVF
jgi:predicted nucleotidyltransferase